MTLPAVCVIPAHDEAPRVGAVVRAALRSGAVTRVVVVDDGSADATGAVAREAGAQVLRLEPNAGKGQAMLAGVRATHEPVVLFMDADLLGLTPGHVERLVAPVVAGRAAMACGLRDYAQAYNRLQRALPRITGERAVLRSVLARVPADFWRGFRVEAGMNAAAGAGVVDVPMWGVKIVPKWHKGDAREGFVCAARMAREVLLALGEAQRRVP